MIMEPVAVVRILRRYVSCIYHVIYMYPVPFARVAATTLYVSFCPWVKDCRNTGCAFSIRGDKKYLKQAVSMSMDRPANPGMEDTTVSLCNRTAMAGR